MIRVITDSTSSIPLNIRDEFNIEVLSLIINRDGVEYIEAKTDLDAFYHDIYDMADNIPTSSQPSAQEIRDALTKVAEAHDDILGVFISSKMSGTFESFASAAQEVAQSYPGFNYAVIDGMTNCMELGFAAISAAKAARKGLSLESCVKSATETLHSSRFVFAPESLKFLEKGGRIGKAAALIGNIVNITPILTVKDGEASTLAKARSQKKAMSKIIKTLEDDMSQSGLKNLVVHYIGSKAPAEKWAEEVINPLIGKKALVLPASPVIGVHVGPAIGIAYECSQRIKDRFASAFPEVVRSYPA